MLHQNFISCIVKVSIMKYDFVVSVRVSYCSTFMCCLYTRTRPASFVPVCPIQFLQHLELFFILKRLYCILPLRMFSTFPELERLDIIGKTISYRHLLIDTALKLRYKHFLLFKIIILE